jgi:hypothetical protein
MYASESQITISKYDNNNVILAYFLSYLLLSCYYS